MVTLATIPVPLSVSDCGLPAALSATLIVAVRAPVAVGVNVTLITHDPVFATSTKPAVQVVVPATMAKSPALAPVMVTGVPAASVTEDAAEFDKVSVIAALVVPCAWLPNCTGAGASPIVPVPVPLSVSACGLPGALSVTLICAVRAPVAPGVKVTLMTHEPVLATNTKPATQVVVPPTMAKSLALAPVNVTGVPAPNVAAPLPVLDTVIVTGAPVVPCAWLPNGTGEGARPTFATVTVKIWAPDNPPPGPGLNVDTATTPAVLIRFVGTVTVNELPLQVVGFSTAFPNCTIVRAGTLWHSKLRPFKVNGNGALFANICVGAILLSVDAGPVTPNGIGLVGLLGLFA